MPSFPKKDSFSFNLASHQHAHIQSRYSRFWLCQVLVLDSLQRVGRNPIYIWPSHKLSPPDPVFLSTTELVHSNAQRQVVANELTRKIYPHYKAEKAGTWISCMSTSLKKWEYSLAPCEQLSYLDLLGNLFPTSWGLKTVDHFLCGLYFLFHFWFPDLIKNTSLLFNRASDMEIASNRIQIG